MTASDGRLLEVSHLSLARGPRQILRGVSLGAARGEIVALMGLSGSGKTTVLRAIAGLDAFDAGTIGVADVTLRAQTAPRVAQRALHQKVGMVFQFHFLFEHLSALDNVTLAPVHVQRTSRKDAEARGRALLDGLGVGHRAAALPRELSGGEAQRVAIARALAVEPPLLLLDEPTASLDPARRGELGHSLRALAAGGRALVMTSHDDEFVEAFATRLLVLADGEVVEQGEPRKVLRDPQHASTRQMLGGG